MPFFVLGENGSSYRKAGGVLTTLQLCGRKVYQENDEVEQRKLSFLYHMKFTDDWLLYSLPS